MFANPEIKAIFCTVGGHTAIQLLSLIDYEIIKKNPKVFLGMSDIDLLHLAINTKTNLTVFHGADPKSGRGLDLDFEYTWENFQNRLMNKSKEEIEKCDVLLIDMTNKPTSRAIEAGIAFAQNKKIISIMKKGTKIKDTTRGISDAMIEYENIKDIVKPLNSLFNEWN